MRTPLSMAREYLDPGQGLAEVLFGLIMTLTFTLAAGVMVREGPDAVRELLIATIGCNIAWGLIDAAFYISGQVFERTRLAKVGGRIRRAATEDEAAAMVESELETLIGDIGNPAERAELHRLVARHVRASRERPRGLTRDDLYGAIASFWLVFFASIPAAVPFLLIDDAWTALRVSNATLIFLLFFTGFRSARYTTLSPWLSGATLMVVGLALVGVTIALGG
jgi:VIT1/CCC1 family predicted Fe2+/Mn2+ transporter